MVFLIKPASLHRVTGDDDILTWYSSVMNKIIYLFSNLIAAPPEAASFRFRVSSAVTTI